MRFSDGTQTCHVIGSLWGPGNRTLIRSQNMTATCYSTSRINRRLPAPKPSQYRPKHCTEQSSSSETNSHPAVAWYGTHQFTACPLVSMISRATQTDSSKRRGWRAADWHFLEHDNISHNKKWWNDMPRFLRKSKLSVAYSLIFIDRQQLEDGPLHSQHNVLYRQTVKLSELPKARPSNSSLM